MNFKIHRPTQEIGNACVEIWTRKTRILINFAIPLASTKVLPNIQGIYKDSSQLLNGMLISNSHQDHYAFVNFLHDDLNYFLGETSFRSINRGNSPGGRELFKNHTFLERYTPFVIGDLKMSPYRMDHSAFENYAFLVEGERSSILYAGDIRGLDSKSEAYQRLIRYAPKNVDYLLLQDHADVSILKEFVNTIQAKNIVPLNTTRGAEYLKLFNYPVLELRDGEEVSCQGN